MKNQLILPCVRAIMGDWIIYTTAMSFGEIAKRVSTDKKYRENPNLDEVLQRDLKERKKNIAKYVLTDNSRFFNSIIIGVFGGPPQWHEFVVDKKIKELTGASTSDYSHIVGFLEFTGEEEMFAIDGQHRVAGMQIAYDEDVKKAIDKQILKDDQVPVIFIAHIEDAKGRKRTRKLFSDININAKGVAIGDQIKINEENLNAIVTRRLYSTYKYFEKGALISLTEQEKLEKDDISHFTNLLGIYGTNKVLLKLFKKIPKTKEWDEENVKEFHSIAKSFYDFVIENVDDYKKFFIQKNLNIKDARKNNAYLLFRPIGLKLLGRLYVHFSRKEKGGLEIMKRKINKINFVMPDSPFNNLLWAKGKMKAREKNQSVAFELCLYLLGELSKEREVTLLAKYRDVLQNARVMLPAKLK